MYRIKSKPIVQTVEVGGSGRFNDRPVYMVADFCQFVIVISFCRSKIKIIVVLWPRYSEFITTLPRQNVRSKLEGRNILTLCLTFWCPADNWNIAAK